MQKKFNKNHNLTYQEAIAQDWQWIMDDLVLEKQSKSEKEQTLKFLRENNYVIAQAKENEHQDKIGIYLPLLPNLSTDKNLTPENANEFGYEYIQDVLYDREAPEATMQPLIDKINSSQFVLGQKASQSLTGYFGLYKKLN